MRRAIWIALTGVPIALSLALALGARATAPTITETIESGSTLTGTVHWQAYPSGGPRPRVTFYVDGAYRWSDSDSPYCYAGDATCTIDTRSLSNGTHTFRVDYLNRSNGQLVTSNTATVTVDNATATAGSWNPHVTRWVVKPTTIAFLEGNETESGGGFPNHLTDFYPKSLTPGQPIPSEIPDGVALVEIDDIETTPVSQPFGGGIGDGDGVDNLVDPRNGLRLHAEISREWGTIRMPDGSIRGPFLYPYPAQTVWPAAGKRIDVQGFVRWDTHNSWWELHPVSSWRIHSTGATSTAATPSIHAQTVRGSILAHEREEASDSG
jgi:hypothetical protein